MSVSHEYPLDADGLPIFPPDVIFDNARGLVEAARAQMRAGVTDARDAALLGSYARQLENQRAGQLHHDHPHLGGGRHDRRPRRVSRPAGRHRPVRDR